MQTYVTESDDAIRSRAHAIWEAEGRPDGRHDIHWQRALADVAAPKAKPAAASDVSLIDGVGPKLTAQLASAGITSLHQVAALSFTDLAALDIRLGLNGRSAREDWIAQAKELVAGKNPRAKVDQAKAARSLS